MKKNTADDAVCSAGENIEADGDQENNRGDDNSQGKSIKVFFIFQEAFIPVAFHNEFLKSRKRVPGRGFIYTVCRFHPDVIFGESNFCLHFSYPLVIISAISSLYFKSDIFSLPP
jgi:hypothetical protein